MTTDRTNARHARIAALRTAEAGDLNFVTWDDLTGEISHGMIRSENIYDAVVNMAAVDEATDLDPGESEVKDNMTGSGVQAILASLYAGTPAGRHMPRGNNPNCITLLSRKADPIDMETLLDHLIDEHGTTADVWAALGGALADFDASVAAID